MTVVFIVLMFSNGSSKCWVMCEYKASVGTED